jgi:DNA-directed RNA polymerase specialized sigma24 family protein
MLRGETAKVTTHPKHAASAPERQRQVHLPTQYQRELIERYKGGATQRELASQYGVHRTTVTKILERHGVEARRGLHPDLIDEAIRRYAKGQSLAAVGRALGADPGTIRARLVEHGVAMRDTHGRPR